MTLQTETAPAPRLAALGLGIARLIYAWLLALYFYGWMELGWSGGIREIHAHVWNDPNLAATVAFAVVLGWLAAAPASKTGDSWIYQRPLVAQALIGAVLAVGVIVMLLL